MAQERKKSFTLKLLIKRLQNHLQHLKSLRTLRVSECEEEVGTNDLVPNDVKEGHFAIVAKNEDEKPTRFVVELCVLKHPDLLRLLKMAEEEYGFQQRGALAVPCGPEELKRILQDKSWKGANEGDYSASC